MTRRAQPSLSLALLPLVVALSALAATLVHAPTAHGDRQRAVVTRGGAPRLQVVTHVRTGSNPKSVHLSPDFRQAWVSNFGFMDHDNVFVYDTDTLEQVGTVSFPGNAVEVAFHPTENIAFVSNFRGSSVERVNRETFAVERSAEVAHHPKYMVISPDGGTLYVASYTGRHVAVVDPTTLEVRRRLATGLRPRGMAVAADGTLYVASFSSDFIQVFSPEGEELTRFSTCAMPRHLEVGVQPHTLLVTCTRGAVGVYDLRTQRRVVRALTGTNPRSLDLGPSGQYVVTANFGSSDVSIVDLQALTHRTVRVPGADRMVGIAIGDVPRHDHSGSRMRIFATSWNNNRLYVLEAR